MLRKIPVTILLVALFISPIAGAAGNISGGGGGKGVVCRNQDQSIKSVELLDLWEARVLHGEVPRALSGQLSADVDVILNRLKGSFPLTMSGGAGNDCQGSQCVISELRKLAQSFLSPHGVKSLRGVKLEATDDSLEVAQPRDCSIEQIVNYEPGRAPILMDQDLFDKMDELNQAALIAHESYYQFLKHYLGEENSIRVRRAIGFVLSDDKELVSPPSLPLKKGQIVCASPSTQQYQYEGVGGLFKMPPNVLIFEKDLSRVDYLAIAGTGLIGISEQMRTLTDTPGSNPLQKNRFRHILLDRSCPAADAVVLWNLDGPVEYDRQIELRRICDHGKTTVYIGVHSPGENMSRSWTFSCKRLDKPYSLNN